MDVEEDTPIDELDKLIEALYQVRSLNHTACVRHSCTAPSAVANKLCMTFGLPSRRALTPALYASFKQASKVTVQRQACDQIKEWLGKHWDILLG